MYIKNTTNTFNVNTWAFAKYNPTCGFNQIQLPPVVVVPPNHSYTYTYPAANAGNPFWKIAFRYMQPGTTNTATAYCGAPILNVIIPGTNPVVRYDVILAGGGTSTLLYFHY